MAALTGRSRGWMRTALALGIGATAMMALTGCLSITSDLTIDSDAKGSGTFTIGLQKQAAQLMGMSDLESFSSGITQQDLAKSESNLLASGTCKASETAEEFVYACTFSDATFTKEGELWTVKKNGNEIVFSMKNQGSTGADAGQMADLLGGSSLGDVTVNVTFPGPIQSITGTGATKTSDTEATVKGAMTDNFDVTITSAASNRPSIGLIIAGAVGVLLLIAIIVGLVLFLVRRGKKAPDALPPAPDGDPAAPAAVPTMPAVPAAAAVAATTAAIPLPAEAEAAAAAPTETLPVTEPPAPEPVVEAPAPEPVVEAPAPEPVVEAPAPEPVVEAPAPEPVVEAPAPEPVAAPVVETPVVEDAAPIIVEDVGPATDDHRA
jgi:hypothetical protein